MLNPELANLRIHVRASCATRQHKTLPSTHRKQR
jgi:hypothetical protein